MQKLAPEPIFAGTPMHAQDINELLHSVKRFVDRRSNYVNNIENMLAKALDMEVNSNICTVSQVRTRASEIGEEKVRLDLHDILRKLEQQSQQIDHIQNMTCNFRFALNVSNKDDNENDSLR